MRIGEELPNPQMDPTKASLLRALALAAQLCMQPTGATRPRLMLALARQNQSVNAEWVLRWVVSSTRIGRGQPCFDAPVHDGAN